MKQLPKDVYVIRKQKTLFGHVRSSGSGSHVFAFVQKIDAMIVKQSMSLLPMTQKLRNDTYLLHKKVPTVPSQVEKTELTTLCSRVCTNNMNVLIISSIEESLETILLYPSHETETMIDDGAQRSMLKDLFSNY